MPEMPMVDRLKALTDELWLFAGELDKKVENHDEYGELDAARAVEAAAEKLRTILKEAGA